MSSRRVLASLLAVVVPALTVAACSSADDPRCVALCTIKEPSTAGAYDICSQASADQCLELCAARIGDATTICADCLLDDADFGTGGISGGGDDCVSPSSCGGSTALCTMTGRGGSCDYCEGDDAAYDACLPKVFPRRAVACETDFGDSSKCAAVCAEK